MPDLTQTLTLLASGAALIVAGLLAIAFLTKHPSSNPTIAAVEDALTKFIYTGILAGEKLVLQSEQTLDASLVNVNRAAVAQAVWNMLPDSIVVEGQTISVSTVKRLIGADRWQVLVKGAYDEAHAFILRNEDYLKKQITIAAKPTGAKPQ